jgi:copper oxidase (laccase) domain-containing protein
MVLTQLLDNKASVNVEEEGKIKTDILTLGEAQLLTFCREKGLINLHEYCTTIKHKSYRQHADYGYLLVASFPD